MASEIQARGPGTARTCYFLVRNATGSIWNGSAFAAYLTANYTTYDVAMTEQGTAVDVSDQASPTRSRGLAVPTGHELFAPFDRCMQGELEACCRPVPAGSGCDERLGPVTQCRPSAHSGVDIQPGELTTVAGKGDRGGNRPQDRGRVRGHL